MSEEKRLNEEELDGVSGGFIEIDPNDAGVFYIKCPNCGRQVRLESLPAYQVCGYCGKESYFTK